MTDEESPRVDISFTRGNLHRIGILPTAGVNVARIAICPECAGQPKRCVQGWWGEWLLYEARCHKGHYWATDLITGKKVAAFGYRMDRGTGDRKANLREDPTEKWNCWPDRKGLAIQDYEMYAGGYADPRREE